MDPDVVLAEIRRLAPLVDRQFVDKELRDDAAAMVVAHVQDLDEWLTKGGSLPKAWSVKVDPNGEKWRRY